MNTVQNAILPYARSVKRTFLSIMNKNRLRWFPVLLLVSAALRLPAQPSEADPRLLANLRVEAGKGDAKAQFNLGDCYRTGEGVTKDMVEAVKWYRKAAEQGHAEGQCALGACYDHGVSVARDPVEAVKWYRKAAEQGLAKAQCNLGVCYYTGEGVAKDAAEAAKYGSSEKFVLRVMEG
jgi:TPR repeat protein